MSRPVVVSDRVVVPGEELQIHFARSGGPGGQNVNKVNSKAVLRWRVTTTTALPRDVRARFLERFASRVTSAGDLVLSADEYREQARNREACRERLRQMILQVLAPPRKRIKTRPGRAANERRLQRKRQQGDKKAQRRSRREGWD
jgi:ribosome-associated protein